MKTFCYEKNCDISEKRFAILGKLCCRIINFDSICIFYQLFHLEAAYKMPYKTILTIKIDALEICKKHKFNGHKNFKFYEIFVTFKKNLTVIF